MDALLYALALLVDAGTTNLFAGEAWNAMPKMQQTDSRQAGAPAEERAAGANGNAIKREGGPLPKDALLPGKPEHSYVIVPPGWEQGNLSLRDGCWAKIYDEDGLKGDAVTIFGPIDIPDLGGGMFGVDWKDRISDIEAGKKARVTIYDNAGQKDALFTIQPGQRFNVNNAIQGFESIRSLKIACPQS
jgi:hypothetical protein